jgi:alkylhydroperoxidase/carboxymuconolactone decarboxylase family protein YurZ
VEPAWARSSLAPLDYARLRAAAGTPTAMQVYARAAMDSADITLAELRELELHFAVFQGFPKAMEFELILNGLDREATT